MNSELINAIVRCAFKICYIYFLKCFIPPINIGSLSHIFSSNDHDRKLKEYISHMKQLILSSSCHNNIESTESIDKDTAYSEIKKNITSQLKEKYGDDVFIEFENKDKDKNKEMDKSIYSLKIKKTGIINPHMTDFDESDIYVNTKTKTFHIRTKRGFEIFPLVKNSIIKCDKK